jgi:hypothetical protein
MARPKKDQMALTRVEESYVSSLSSMTDQAIVSEYQEAVSGNDVRAVFLIAGQLSERLLSDSRARSVKAS